MTMRPTIELRRFCAAATAAAALISWLPAQTSSIYPWEPRRLPGVPAPGSVLLYEPGDRMIDHADALRYLDALAAASDRVRLFSYARSHEGRLLRYAVISSPSNLARLQDLRQAMGRLAGPSGLSAEDANGLIHRTPVFVWLAYSVHGNEHSSTEAALAVAYHLASADDDRTHRVLDGAVIFIDPIQNPDGRERFIHSYVEAAGPRPITDPAAAEHDEPWPSGRFNHDLFDMNRDWFFQTQPEVRGKINAFLAWHPVVFVDLHEMGTDQTYYFPPPSLPINANVADSTMRWFKVIGEGNARMFDSLGFDYFTHEIFDLFYPGYGDSWPTLNGAAGMTFEEAGAQGLAIEKKDGSVLTLRDAMRRHIASSLATAETAAAHREEILRDFYVARKSALDDSAGGVRAFVIPSESDAGGASHLAKLLVAEGLQVLRADEPFSVRASTEPTSPAESRRFPLGSFVLPLAQPGRRLLSALFERDPKLDEKFLQDVSERRRLHDGAPFYDITAWSLPLAMNLVTYQTLETPRGASTPLVRAVPVDLPGHDQPPPGFGPWPPPIDSTIRLADAGPESPPSQATNAYLLSPAGNGALAAFAALVKDQELNVQVAAKSFTLNGRAYPPGTAILKVHRNPGILHARVTDAASAGGASVETTATGLVEEGIDLGSSSVLRVRMPRIATLYGEPASPTSVGSLGYVLGERYGLPYSPVRARTLTSQADLRRYDVIILPDGNASGYREAFGKDGIDRLKDWIEAGGTMVTIKGASAFAAMKQVAWTSAHLVRKRRSGPIAPAGAAPPASGSEIEKPKSGPGAAAPAAQDSAGPESDPNGEASEISEDENPDAVPGAVLRVLLEPSNPLSFGYAGEVPVIVTSNLVFSLSKEGVNAGVFAPRDRLRMGGFLFKESFDLLAGRPYVLTEKVGRGTVVLFVDDPDFRGGWDGLNRMLLNAILLVPAFAS